MASSLFMTDDVFRQFLRDQDYVIDNVKDDGNCLYRAIAKGILDDDEMYSEIRKDLYAYVNVKKDTETFRVYFTGYTPKDEEKEIEDLINKKQWGSFLALLAASEYYEYNIVVHLRNGSLQQIPDNLRFNRTIHLSYHNNNHYNHLRLREIDTTNENSQNFDKLANSGINPGKKGKSSNNSSKSSSISDPEEDNSSDMTDENGPNDSAEGSKDEMEVDYEESDVSDVTSGHESQDDMDMDIYQESDNNDESSEDEVDEDQNHELIADEDDGEFTRDCPNLEHDNNQSTYRTLSSLLSSYTFKFLANKFFSSSRNYLDVIILVRKKYCRETLLETLSNLKGRRMFLLVDYSQGKIRKELLTDDDISIRFEVFKKRIYLPSESAFHTRSVWLSYVLIVPLLLSALRYSWNGVSIEVLCKKSSKSLAAHLLNYYWSEMRSDIVTDVATIIANPGILFCEKCQPSCQWREKKWHISLHGFKKQKFETPSMYGFMEKYNLFQCLKSTKSGAMENLRNVYYSNDRNLFSILVNLFDDNYAFNYRDKMYSSYLVLIFDGQNMDEFSNNTVNQLLKNESVYKLLYAGCCTGENFRSSHFTQKSAVFDVLTKHSRIYFVRQRWYKSRDAARTDEGVVIEMLKAIVNRHRLEGSFPGFYLLNNTSSPSFLLRLSADHMAIMTRFCDSGIPVINMDDENTAYFPDGVFKGNYKVETPVTMQPGPYEEREFEDVEEKYEEIKYRC